MYTFSDIRLHILSALCLFGAVVAHANNASNGIDIFTIPSMQNQWTGPNVKAVRISKTPIHGGAGLVLPLQMQKVQDRAFWDATTKLNLRDWRVITFDIKIDHPEAIRRGAIYFRSGKGWYGGWFDVKSTGWKRISLSRTDFSEEEDPAGWGDIDAVRLSFWKEADIATTAQVANLRATNVPILILRNTDAASVLPSDANLANRLVDRLQMWCSQYGIPTAVITDDELRSSLPSKDTRIVILPYNPVLTNQVPQQLRAFTKTGGKLIVAYSLNDNIAPLLDIDEWQWKKALPKDACTALHFADGSRLGIPEKVVQNSWNINIPVRSQATTLATWQNSKGITSDIPAVTLAPNGVYIGHVLTNTGRENKMRMLAGLCALLAPDLAPMLSNAALEEAVTLLGHDNWKSTKMFITQSARKHHRFSDISSDLVALDTDIRKLQDRLPSLSYPQASVHIWNVAQQVQNIFYRAFSSTTAQKNEFRGIWAHDANGVSGMTWAQTVEELNNAGINNLFVNLLWGGAAFYPSRIMPNVSQGKDYAREVLESTKSTKIQTHAWIVLWSLQYAPDTYIAKMRKEGRLQYDSKGKELEWLCPSHPANRKIQIDAAAEIIRKYPFQGFHLDYIRYSSANACFCPGCKVRFEKDTGEAVHNWPHDVSAGNQNATWLEWRRNVISSLVEEFHRTLKATRKDIVLSAAVWPEWPSVRNSIAQDWPLWAEKGWIDFFTPMNYVTTAEEAKRYYRQQRKAVPRRTPIYPGIAPTTYNLSPAEALWHIDQLRDVNAPGFVLFDLDWDLIENHLPALRKGTTQE